MQRKDGGYGYGATDLAAIRYRTQGIGAWRLLYIVGLPQNLHLEMVFAVAREAGWLEAQDRVGHVGFGSVLGSRGKMLRSRVGGTVKLSEILDEAVTRAAAVVAEKNSQLDEEARCRVATTVGIGAMKYADLSTDRARDYVFDFGRMLAFDGNTAPYLQYAYARIESVLRKADNVWSRDHRSIELVHRPSGAWRSSCSDSALRSERWSARSSSTAWRHSCMGWPPASRPSTNRALSCVRRVRPCRRDSRSVI